MNMQRKVGRLFGWLLLGMAFMAGSAGGASASDNDYFIGPDAVENLLEEPSPMERLAAWRERLRKEQGFDFGLDYNLIGFVASASPGERRSASGVARLFGQWTLVGRDGPDSGGLVFKVEHRHAFTDVAPVDFGGEIGYAGLVQSTFSDQKGRLTNLYWKQNLLGGRMVIFAGYLDVTDYVDVYLMASPWDGFGNLAFATGSATIGTLPDGSLGLMAAGWLSERVYLVAGIADANADPTDPAGGFDSLFHTGETFKSLELGWTTERKRVFLDNLHVTLWQADARKEADVSEGKGVALSLVRTFDERTMLFARGGWSDDGGGLLEAAVSVGAGRLLGDGRGVVGLGLNWGRPNDEFYDNHRNQYTAELFCRLDHGPLQVTPDLQLIRNPADVPDRRWLAVFGLRLALRF